MNKTKNMKKIIGLFLTTVGCAAANFISENFINGTNAIFTTATTLTTFKYDDGSQANRNYVPKPYTLLANGTVDLTKTAVPKSTTASGSVVPSLEISVWVWVDGNGNTATNTVITVYGGENTGGGSFSKLVWLTFVRSADGGATYATDDPGGTFIVGLWDPFSNTTISTNVPPAFFAGASHIRFWSFTATNGSAGAGNVYISHLRISGYTL